MNPKKDTCSGASFRKPGSNDYGAAVTVLVLLLLATAATAESDCAPYQPSEADDSISGSWGAAFEIDNYEITVPSDPGGGYVIAWIETDAPSRPRMTIGDVGSITQSAPTYPGPSPQRLEVAFEAKANRTYPVAVSEDAVSSAFPVAYTFGWRFVSRVDCFEPNQRQGSAAYRWPEPLTTSKTIPLDENLGAYSLAGHGAAQHLNRYERQFRLVRLYSRRSYGGLD